MRATRCSRTSETRTNSGTQEIQLSESDVPIMDSTGEIDSDNMEVNSKKMFGE